jgi:hypothetical protein
MGSKLILVQPRSRCLSPDRVDHRGREARHPFCCQYLRHFRHWKSPTASSQIATADSGGRRDERDQFGLVVANSDAGLVRAAAHMTSDTPPVTRCTDHVVAPEPRCEVGATAVTEAPSSMYPRRLRPGRRRAGVMSLIGFESHGRGRPGRQRCRRYRQSSSLRRWRGSPGIRRC